jgi:hypothetical protein
MNTKSIAGTIAFILLAASMGITLVAAQEPDPADLKHAVDAHNAEVAKPEQELVCRKEAQIGTRIKKTICRTKDVIAAESEEAKRWANKPRPVPTHE